MRIARWIRYLLCVICTGAVHASALTDPTRPSGFVAPADDTQAAKSLRLESVLISTDRRVAVINGKACRIGERVDGATLMAINTDGAVVMRNGQRIALPLLKVKVRNHAN